MCVEYRNRRIKLCATSHTAKPDLRTIARIRESRIVRRYFYEVSILPTHTLARSESQRSTYRDCVAIGLRLRIPLHALVRLLESPYSLPTMKLFVLHLLISSCDFRRRFNDLSSDPSTGREAKISYTCAPCARAKQREKMQ